MSCLVRTIMGAFLCLIATTAVAATQVQIDQARAKGLAWILSHQNGDGSWKSVAGTEIHATAAVSEALSNAGIKRGYAYSVSHAWLGNAEALSCDSLARQSIALFRSGTNVDALVTRLTSMRHPRTKSWGAYDQFFGSFPDTSLAMDAFAIVGTTYSDTGTSLGFIGGTQNTDGGWSYTSTRGEPGTLSSRLIPTAHNSLTLSRYKTKGWNVDTNLTKGVNWLISKKKTDGGFAEDTSATTGSVYETALVWLALSEAKKAGNAAAVGAQSVMDSTLDFLIAKQQADGSWGAEPIQTALALQTFPTTSLTDSDYDGIPDVVEVLLGTNPAVADWRDRISGNGQSIAGVTASQLTATAVVNQAFSKTITVSGGTAPYTWKIVSGSLPSGLNLAASTGVISGTPTTVGLHNFIYSVNDKNGLLTTMGGQIQVVPASISVAASPSRIASDYVGSVAININNYTALGAEVLVEEMVDANRNGTIDVGDYVIRSFKVTDGSTSSNPNVPGDSDDSPDYSISTTLNYRMLNDVYHAPGNYLIRVTSNSKTALTAFVVDPISQLQSVSGTVLNGAVPVPGAVVSLVDKWQRTVSHAIADGSGQYVLNVKNPGDYFLIPYSYQLVASSTPITLSASQSIVNKNLTMVSGSYHVLGKAKDVSSGAGIAGVWVKAMGNTYSAVAMTDTGGNYDLLLPAGEYDIVGGADVAGPAFFSKGYVGFERRPHLSVSGNVSGIDFSMQKASVFMSGKVVDEYGFSVPGVLVQGRIPISSDVRKPVAYGITDSDGDYTLGLSPGNNWNIALNNDAAQVLGYTSSQIVDFSTSAGALTGNNLVAHAIKAWIKGSIKNASNSPIGLIDLKARDAGSTINLSTSTAADGSYSIGVYAGSWFVDALTEENGYPAVTETSLTISDGQTSVANFTVPASLVLGSSVLPSGKLSVSYSKVLTATSGTTPYTWSIVSGSLPAGLSLNASTGTISGIPTTAGTFSFTVQVKDAGGVIRTRSLLITVV